MASGTANKPILNSYSFQTTSGQTHDVDITPYQGNGFFFLVTIRSWAALNSYFSIYIVQGIQNGGYQYATELSRGAENVSKVEIKDAHTITITFYNSQGGYYSIVPLL